MPFALIFTAHPALEVSFAALAVSDRAAAVVVMVAVVAAAAVLAAVVAVVVALVVVVVDVVGSVVEANARGPTCRLYWF